MVINLRWQQSPVTLSVKPNCLTVSIEAAGGTSVYSYRCNEMSSEKICSEAIGAPVLGIVAANRPRMKDEPSVGALVRLFGGVSAVYPERRGAARSPRSVGFR